MLNQLSPKQKKLAAAGLGAAIVLFLFLRSRSNASAAQVTTTSAPDALTAAPAGVPADFGTDPSGAGGGTSSAYDPSAALGAIGDQINGLAGTVADNSAAVSTLSDTVAANANQIATAGTPESFGQQLTDVVGAVKAVNAITHPKAAAKPKPAVTHQPAHTPARSPSQHPAAVHHKAARKPKAKPKPKPKARH